MFSVGHRILVEPSAAEVPDNRAPSPAPGVPGCTLTRAGTPRYASSCQ
jgi:hypothetical protein